jgi:signal transduction histidine kinase
VATRPQRPARYRSGVTTRNATATTNNRITIAVWIGVLVAAVAIGLLAEPPQFAGRAAPRMPAPPPDFGRLLYQLGVGSATWYALVIGAPLLAVGARRFDTERLSRTGIAVRVVSALAVLITSTALLQFWVSYRGVPNRPSLSMYWPQVLRQGVLPWIALTGIIASLEARRRALEQRIEQERLRAEVAEQRLLALTAQLHPHFLFNTLQGISTLIHRDPDGADELLAKLGDLLRDLLRHRDRAIVPLADEIRYARTYLEVAKIRFADRLRFEIDVPADLHDAAVPLFVLQPLVENALGHGIGARLEGGSIVVRVRRQENRLLLEVEDNGAGLTSSRIREGIGLSNTRERLRASFGDDFTFALEPVNTGGTLARIAVPLRREPVRP